MNRHPPLLAAAIAAMALTLGSSAFAQEHGGQRPSRESRPEQRQDARVDERRDDRHDDRHDNRRADRRPAPRVVQHDPRFDDHRGDPRYAGRGAGPEHAYYRGGRLPAYYRSNQYVVDDWRGHRLSAPPRGYHWVQTGSDYVLVAVATGIIASILLSN